MRDFLGRAAGALAAAFRCPHPACFGTTLPQATTASASSWIMNACLISAETLGRRTGGDNASTLCTCEEL
eukprot:CAMPEP_0169090102 /NCGR_PEP_ID=MMETSP1015-20121227/15642_1 /TAXON_ID=342587 /ORGANISM="Karlodinium micrum, Strain CCMP2283" /LENGTH=69 /DNA_ID=CAMNT_0009150489 /DNA_START=132 /DNA_END=341 /DNA_ORIENTATION=-